MEYIISNKPFIGSERFGNVYYKGEFNFTQEKLVLLEGEIVGKSEKDILGMNIQQVINSDFNGFFNYLSYNIESNQLIIKNDKLGKMLLYVFHKENTFILSNCFWHIIKNIKDTDIEIDEHKLKQYLFFLSILDSSGTYFKSIRIIPAASIFKLDVSKNIYNIQKYWEFEYIPDKNLTLNDAVNQLDNGLYRMFEDIKERNRDSVFGFGNSGGLDSRLVAFYANEVNMPMVGYTIGNAKPNKILYSTSFKNSHIISKQLDFFNTDISYASNNYCNRLELSIRNNPFGSNEMLKNPFEKIPEFDVLLTGQQGALVGGSAFGNFYEDDDCETLCNQLFFFFSKQKGNSLNEKNNYKRYLHKALKKLQVKEDKYKDAKNPTFEKSVLDYIFSSDDICYFKNLISNIVNKKSYKSPQNIRWYMYHEIVAQKDYSGGFESINRTKKTYYIYGQYNLDNILKWPYDFLYNRKALKQLLANKSAKLAKIPGQDMENIIGEENRIKHLLRTAEFLLRFGHGLDYYNWIKSKEFQIYARTVLERKNPIFNDIFNINELMKLDVTNYLFIMDLLQVKKILDVIYYKEYDFINESLYFIK